MSAVNWILSSRDDVHVGDVVSSDAGGMPTYRVMAIEHDEAVLEDEHHAAVRAPLTASPGRPPATRLKNSLLPQGEKGWG